MGNSDDISLEAVRQLLNSYEESRLNSPHIYTVTFVHPRNARFVVSIEFVLDKVYSDREAISTARLLIHQNVKWKFVSISRRRL